MRELCGAKYELSLISVSENSLKFKQRVKYTCAHEIERSRNARGARTVKFSRVYFANLSKFHTIRLGFAVSVPVPRASSTWQVVEYKVSGDWMSAAAWPSDAELVTSGCENTRVVQLREALLRND